MGKAARRKKAGKKENVEETPQRALPNWPLFGLALIGMGLAAYLTATTWAGQTVAGCEVGGGCDAVLNSHWSKLFGLPISLWGFLLYAALAAIAFIKRPDLQWKLACAVALFGVLYSLYLTSISVTELHATCPYCLSSLTLLLVILGTVTYQQPRKLPGFSWSPWLLKTIPGAVVLVLILHLHYAGFWGKGLSSEEDPKVQALAAYLAKKDVKFYGAYWCPHCQEQKELFGPSAKRLPYIECSPLGPDYPQAKACNDAGVQRYPTWFIDGQRHEGVLTLEELAQYSRFPGGYP